MHGLAYMLNTSVASPYMLLSISNALYGPYIYVYIRRENPAFLQVHNKLLSVRRLRDAILTTLLDEPASQKAASSAAADIHIEGKSPSTPMRFVAWAVNAFTPAHHLPLPPYDSSNMDSSINSSIAASQPQQQTRSHPRQKLQPLSAMALQLLQVRVCDGSSKHHITRVSEGPPDLLGGSAATDLATMLGHAHAVRTADLMTARLVHLVSHRRVDQDLLASLLQQRRRFSAGEAKAGQTSASKGGGFLLVSGHEKPTGQVVDNQLFEAAWNSPAPKGVRLNGGNSSSSKVPGDYAKSSEGASMSKSGGSSMEGSSGEDNEGSSCNSSGSGTDGDNGDVGQVRLTTAGASRAAQLSPTTSLAEAELSQLRMKQPRVRAQQTGSAAGSVAGSDASSTPKLAGDSIAAETAAKGEKSRLAALFARQTFLGSSPLGSSAGSAALSFHVQHLVQHGDERQGQEPLSGSSKVGASAGSVLNPESITQSQVRLHSDSSLDTPRPTAPLHDAWLGSHSGMTSIPLSWVHAHQQSMAEDTALAPEEDMFSLAFPSILAQTHLPPTLVSAVLMTHNPLQAAATPVSPNALVGLTGTSAAKAPSEPEHPSVQAAQLAGSLRVQRLANPMVLGTDGLFRAVAAPPPPPPSLVLTSALPTLPFQLLPLNAAGVLLPMLAQPPPSFMLQIRDTVQDGDAGLRPSGGKRKTRQQVTGIAASNGQAGGSEPLGGTDPTASSSHVQAVLLLVQQTQVGKVHRHCLAVSNSIVFSYHQAVCVVAHALFQKHLLLGSLLP